MRSTNAMRAFHQEVARSLITGVPIGKEVRYTSARDSFFQFARLIKPGYEWSWHHRVMANALQDVAQYILTGEGTSRLIFVVPPRHTKSTFVSECFTPWLLGYAAYKHGRHLTSILGSYSFELAASFGAAARDIVKSETYQAIFPGVRVARGHEAAHNWKIEGSPERVSMLSSGVGGATTGFGGHVIIIDDPIKNAEEASSPTILEKQWEWYTQVARTRLMPGGAIVLTMTRWAYDDLVGRVLDNDPGGWRVIHLKAIADEDEVPYRAKGEALWPTWFSKEMMERTREEIGERAFSTLYQGEPIPKGGHALRVEWLQSAPEMVWRASLGSAAVLDDAGKVIRDAAPPWPMVYGVDPSTGEGNDYTAIAKVRWNLLDRNAILVDVIRGRWSFSELVNVLMAEAEVDHPVKIVIEKVAFSAWVTQHLDATTHLPVVGSKFPRTSKNARMAAIGALGSQFETGRVMLPPPEHETPGIVTFMQEWGRFPAGANDDTLDAVNLAIEGVGLATKMELPSARFLFSGREAARRYSLSPFDE